MHKLHNITADASLVHQRQLLNQRAVSGDFDVAMQQQEDAVRVASAIGFPQTKPVRLQDKILTTRQLKLYRQTTAIAIQDLVTLTLSLSLSLSLRLSLYSLTVCLQLATLALLERTAPDTGQINRFTNMLKSRNQKLSNMLLTTSSPPGG